MCMSAEVDLVVGGLVTAVGVDALRHVDRRAQIPLALLPIVLGTHQLVESAVWRQLERASAGQTGGVAEWAYLFVALVVVPVLVPAALLLIEPDARRRRWQRGCVALGVVVAVWLGVALARGAAVARPRHLHIAYFVDAPFAEVAAVAYVIATCGPALLSSRRSMRIFGVANLVVVGLLTLLLIDGVISLWCAWAAITSVAVDTHLRSSGRTHRTLGRSAAAAAG